MPRRSSTPFHRSSHAARALCSGALALAALSLAPAHALQLVEARDGVAVEAILSIQEPTRIRIESAPITGVVGNILSGTCGSAAPALGTMTTAAPAGNAPGEIVLECDRDKGEIYVRPVGAAGKPVNLFVSSAQATYTLVLRRSDTPADTIVIRDRTLRGQPVATPAPSPHHVRAMKALLVAMASDRVPADIRVDELGQPVQLSPDTRLLLVRRYEGRGLLGERYLLRNIGAATLALVEQDFDREQGEVIGVAIEERNLRPGNVTSVFVIRRGGER